MKQPVHLLDFLNAASGWLRERGQRGAHFWTSENPGPWDGTLLACPAFIAVIDLSPCVHAVEYDTFDMGGLHTLAKSMGFVVEDFVQFLCVCRRTKR